MHPSPPFTPQRSSRGRRLRPVGQWWISTPPPHLSSPTSGRKRKLVSPPHPGADDLSPPHKRTWPQTTTQVSGKPMRRTLSLTVDMDDEQYSSHTECSTAVCGRNEMAALTDGDGDDETYSCMSKNNPDAFWKSADNNMLLTPTVISLKQALGCQSVPPM